jgi:hypothetical protein
LAKRIIRLLEARHDDRRVRRSARDIVARITWINDRESIGVFVRQRGHIVLHHR